MVPADLN